LLLNVTLLNAESGVGIGAGYEVKFFMVNSTEDIVSS